MDIPNNQQSSSRDGNTLPLQQSAVIEAANRIRIVHSNNLETIPPDEMYLGVVQLSCKQCATVSEFVAGMNHFIATAVNQRAHLVCFPMYTGMLPVTLNSKHQTQFQELMSRSEDGKINLDRYSDILAYCSMDMIDVFHTTMSVLAKRYGVYVMGGTAVYRKHQQFHHRAFLFDDKGELVGVQDKLLEDPLGRALQVELGTELNIFSTPMGNIAILIGNDVESYELAKIAKNSGAQVILNPTAISQYNSIDASLGLNLRVQEQGIYGVQSTLVGDTGAGVVFDAPSCLIKPILDGRSKALNGITEQTHGRIRSEVLPLRLNLQALEIYQHDFRSDKNPVFLEENFNIMY